MGFPMASMLSTHISGMKKYEKQDYTLNIFLIYSHKEGWSECSSKKFWLLW